MVLESRHLFGLFILLAVLFGVVFTLGYLLGRGQGDSQAHIAAIRAEDSANAATANPANALAGDDDTGVPATSASPAGSDWSYYHAGDSKPANDALEPAPSPSASKPASKPAAKPAPAATAAKPEAKPDAKPAVKPTAKPTAKPAPSSPTPAPTSASKPAAKPAPAAAKPAPGPTPAAPAPTKPSAKPAAMSKPNVAVGSPMIPKGAIVLQVAALEKESDALAVAQALQQRKFPAFVLPASADKYFRVQVGPYANAQAATAAQKQLESAGFKSIVKR